MITITTCTTTSHVSHWPRRSLLLCGIFFFLVLSSIIQAEDAIDFETHIAPLIVSRCVECHNTNEASSGLDLTQMDALTKGGESGLPTLADTAENSLLYQRVLSGEMPPESRGQSQKLPEEEIELLRRWINQGAPWPQDRKLGRYERTTSVRGGLDWWSFQPVVRTPPPEVTATDRVTNPIDAFVIAKLEANNMTMAPLADRRTLLRRAYFDVIGLPPTLEEMNSFLTDDSENAYEHLVDQLLESKHYGERWARYWLDLVRFAETCGYERDQQKPQIWQYRDWVVRAFNDDMPFDRFVQHQLAGDEIPDADEQSVIATGMLRAGTWNDEPNDSADYLYTRLEDMVHTTSSAFLGLTVKCARCHDHKFDPIPQVDYYRVASYFWAGYVHETNRATLGGPSSERLGYEVFGWTDRAREVNAIRLLTKGDRHRPAQEIQPASLSTIPALQRAFDSPPEDADTTHRRLQFAQWITHPANPLTPRVFTNRLWQHHFGAGIVRTPNNFGFKGDLPTHPQLLDWLAAEFMEGGWGIKRLHKLILMSSTYRQMSLHPQQESYSKRDFLNHNLWRQNRRRRDAESLRDALLASSGALNPKLGGPSFFPRMSAEALEGLSKKGRAWGSSSQTDRSRRSIYMMTKRSRILPLMTTFDFCDTTLPCGQRDVTTVAPQALALLNNHFVHEQSENMANRLYEEVGNDPRRQIERAWQYAFARAPADEELEIAMAHLEAQELDFGGPSTDSSVPTDQAELDLLFREGLALWLRADRDVTLDKENRVITWQDHSEYASLQTHPKHATQTIASARPQMVPDAIHGKPAIRFDGGSSFLQLSGKPLWKPQFTIIAVAVSGADGGTHEIISNWHQRGRSISSVFLGIQGEQVRFSDQFAQGGKIANPQQPFILTAVNGTDDAITFQNGKELGRLGAPLANRDLEGPYVIGTQGNYGTEFWQGDIAEILVYEHALDAAALTEVWSYLGQRYKLETELPQDPKRLALASLCHVLMNSNEFIYID